jgi:polyhydroxybutyrate depolymerase
MNRPGNKMTLSGVTTAAVAAAPFFAARGGPSKPKATKWRAAATGLVLLACISAACSSSPNGVPTQPASGTATAAAPAVAVSMAPVRSSSGCPGPNPSASGATTETITVAGAQRTYRRYLPEHADNRPLPVVIDLHPLGRTIDEQVKISAFEAAAARETFIVLTPQGAGTPANWSFAENAANVDVQFITSMLDEVEAAACVDTARVYAAGYSAGANLASALTCLRGDRIAAVGLVSGGTGRSGTCHPPRAIAVMIFWGKKDVLLPYCGGVGNIAFALIQNQPIPTAIPPTCPPANLFGFLPVDQAVSNWAAANGCDPNPNVAQVAVGVEQRDFGRCDQASAVRFFVVADGGHTWPGSKVMKAISDSATGAPSSQAGLAEAIGFTTDAIDATQLMWTFFQRYALTDITR